MPGLDLDRRINAFVQLSDFMQAVARQESSLVPSGLEEFFYEFQDLIPRLYDYNGWFAEEFVRYQLSALAEASTRENIERWLENYRDVFEENSFDKAVAVVMAGNIPFVGFTDYISVLISGHRLLAKL